MDLETFIDWSSQTTSQTKADLESGVLKPPRKNLVSHNNSGIVRRPIRIDFVPSTSINNGH